MTKTTQELSSRDTDYWLLPASEVFSALKTGPQGLSSDEAKSRLAAYGLNSLPQQRSRIAGIIFRQLKSPMIVILAGATILSALFGQLDQSAIMIIVIVLSVGIGVYNESSSERIVEDLRKRVSIRSVVVRDQGKVSETDSTLLVPGDVVVVNIGDIVSADMRIVESNNLEADQSVLTGESFPAEKSSDKSTSNPSSSPSEAANYLFAGTVIVRGTGRAVVVSTGRNTQFGLISVRLERARPATDFQKGVKSYGNLLITLTVALAGGIFILNAVVGHSLINSLLFSLAIAIGLVPELMPAIVTVTLSRGAHRMAKQEVIVKRLVSMENFGNIDILCTDKTGTLTEGKVVLKEYLYPDGRADGSASGSKISKVLLYGLLCNDAIVGGLDDKSGNEASVSGNPLDVGIWKYAMGQGFKDVTRSFRRIGEVPFDYHRRILSVVVAPADDVPPSDRPNTNALLISKGAPEAILGQCVKAERGSEGKEEPLTTEIAGSVNAQLAELSRAGYRTIAVAYKHLEAEKEGYTTDDENGLSFLGLLVFSDPPKAGAKEAIDKLKGLAVDLKVVTGDNEAVALKVCEDLGVTVKKSVIGSDLVRMSLAELKATVEEATLFARVNPEQKLDIIKALKDNGHTVGFMGDGVNDAPALYEADTGISVDEAVDVAKDAADIVLLKKDLKVIANGIAEGRRTFGNTMKYILMATSSNFGNMFSAAAASVFLPFLPMLPMQILFMNLLYDLVNMTIPTDNVDEEYTKAPKHWDISFVRKFTLFFGPFSSLYDFLTFGIMLFIFGASAGLFQTGWFIESFWTEVLVIFVIRTRRIPFFSSKPGKWLTIVTLAAVVFGTVLPFTPVGAFLQFTPPPVQYWALLVVMVATYLLLVDAGKVFFYRVCGF